MRLDGTGQTLEQIGASLVGAGHLNLRIWPENQRMQELGDPRILGTQFPDISLFHDSAIALVTRAAADLAPNIRGYGGRKVRDAATWGSPELTLLNWRALYLFCATRGVQSAHVVDRWINFMEHDDYSSAHCHFESDAAIVYSLDPGDPNPQRPASGRLEIIDSRIPICCPRRPERPTRKIAPEMLPGTMIVFPAEFIHLVNPYDGFRPRITVAWNISAGTPPPDLPDLTQQGTVIVTTEDGKFL